MLSSLHALLGILEVQVIRNSNNDQLDILVTRDLLQALNNPYAVPTSILGCGLGVRLASFSVRREVCGTFQDGVEGEEVRVGGDDWVVKGGEGESCAENGCSDRLSWHYGNDTILI